MKTLIQLFAEVKKIKIVCSFVYSVWKWIKGVAVVILSSYQINESIILTLCSSSLDSPVFSPTNPRIPKFNLESTKMCKQVLKST